MERPISASMSTSICDLPEGLVTEILLRVPAKSVVKCKAVCKYWPILISNPNFIKTHIIRTLNASPKTPTLLTIENPPLDEDEIELHRQVDEEQHQILQEMQQKIQQSGLAGYFQQQEVRRNDLVNQAPRIENIQQSVVHFDRVVRPRLFDSAEVVASYNGIICLAEQFGFNIYLWNPTIMHCKKLPPPIKRRPKFLLGSIWFGYDSVSDDYMVIRIAEKNMLDNHDVTIAQVYSENADSWTEFPAPILDDWYTGCKRSNIVVNGWVLYIQGRDHLLMFDLHNEVFELVQYPSSVETTRSDILDFEGSVAMVFKSVGEGSVPGGINLWTLDSDDCGNMSWTPKFGIESDSETEIDLSFYLGSGLFYGVKMFKEKACRTHLYNCLYDYEKKESILVGIEEPDNHSILKYTESLVSFNGFKQVDQLRLSQCSNGLVQSEVRRAVTICIFGWIIYSSMGSNLEDLERLQEVFYICCCCIFKIKKT